jgi:hypothetical protein
LFETGSDCTTLYCNSVHESATCCIPRRHLLHQIRTSLRNNKKPSEKLKGNYLYPRIKRHAKMVLIGLQTTINSDRTNDLLAAPTDRRDTKYY